MGRYLVGFGSESDEAKSLPALGVKCRFYWDESTNGGCYCVEITIDEKTWPIWSDVRVTLHNKLNKEPGLWSSLRRILFDSDRMHSTRIIKLSQNCFLEPRESQLHELGPQGKSLHVWMETARIQSPVAEIYFYYPRNFIGVPIRVDPLL